MSIRPQMHDVPAELTVLELVEQDRFPHVGTLGMLRRRNDAALEGAVRLTCIEDFVHRPLDTTA